MLANIFHHISEHIFDIINSSVSYVLSTWEWHCLVPKVCVKIDFVSLYLFPLVTVDYWSYDCWLSYLRNFRSYLGVGLLDECATSLTSIIFCLLLLLPSILSAYKVDLLKNKFGFDEAFNYKEEPDLAAALKRLVVITAVIIIFNYHGLFSWLVWIFKSYKAAHLLETRDYSNL